MIIFVVLFKLLQLIMHQSLFGNCDWWNASVCLQQQNCCLLGTTPTGVTYEQGDARSLSYTNESFDIILDKGTIDAMMCSNDEGFDNARRICGEAARLLKIGGCFFIVSHMSPSGHEGNAFVNESLIPSLRAQPASSGLFEVGVHFSEEAAETGPFVYAVQKRARRATRSSKRAKTGGDASTEIILKLHEY
jgi:SAM-dependent methyltransferase